MTARRGTAVAIALFVSAALAAAGCGLGPGEGVGEVELTVTRDYGSVPMVHRELGDVTESGTVMRALEGSAEIATRYGGGFVQSIEGVEAEERLDRSFDWFFYVNGVEATVGAADYDLSGGEAIWWDYRDWSGAMRVPAVVGSWPQPFLDGYGGRRWPVVVQCLSAGPACEVVRQRLDDAGVKLASGAPDDALRVVVGPWAKVREDSAAGLIENGPQASGVFAGFELEDGDYVLQGLDEGGEVERTFDDEEAGLVAATRRYDAPPVWVVTGAEQAGVSAAAELLDAASLRDHYAIVAEGGEGTPLPLR